MEDIMNLNKVDFPKTYGRPRGLRSSPSHSKSQSTNSSPSASPSLGDSHTKEESASPFSRNRSRSLKQLTNKLKTGKYSTDNQQTNIPEGSEQTDPVPDVNVTDVDARSRESSPEETASEVVISEEDADHQTKESSPRVDTPQHSVDRELEAIHSESSSEPCRQESLDSLDHEQTPESDGAEDHGSDIKTSHEYVTLNIDRQAEDEGVEEGDTPSPIVSTFTYHPIGRNSPFLKLASTCPKRRTGITTLATLGRVQQLYGKNEEGKTEDASGKRFQRRDGTQAKGNQKMSPVRFITHPPHRKASFREDGSMDSNGFGALKASSADSDDEQKLSQLSLTDSQYCPSEGMEDSYQEVVDSVIGEHADPEKQDRKNGKSLKHKSKSDPSGDKTRDLGDFPKVNESSQSHSAPLLSKDGDEASSDEDDGDEAKPKSHSENILSSGSNIDENTAEQGIDDDELDQSENETSNLLSPSSAHSIVFSSAPTTPQDNLPLGITEHSERLLSVPTPRKPILRSASSASVLTRKAYGSTSKDKDAIRKYSITTDEKPATLSPDFSPLGDSGLATSMPVVWKDRIGRSESPERDPSFIKDKRYHIVEELYRNEKEYVEALRTLKDKYMIPLKTQSSLDDAIVDNIFYMIPEILTHHSIYLDFLDNVWKHWDSATSTVGNIIITIFSKQTVLESYLSFVENYKTSGRVIENALSTKSSIQKFLENCQRDSGSKLSIKDLIVRPIQRIPRYELLIQRLLDNTPRDHPDFDLLQHADKVMHDLAIKIGTLSENQSEEDMQQTLKKLELLLITDLAVPDRSYLRHDMVQILNKKDQCCIWFFSDLIIISSIKRKSGPVTRKVSIILKTPMGQDFTENMKHKVWLRVGLDDIEIVKTQGSLTRRPTIDHDQVEDDLAILSQLSELASRLSCQHQNLEDVIKEMTSMLNKQLAECSTRSSLPDSNKMELLVTTQEGILHLVIAFPSADKKSSWECLFYDAKQKLALLSDKRAPEFLQPLQITKTRAGMQFSCAAPIDGLNANGFRDVWVCNSDGYVGHMCLLSLQPEPIVTLNTPVPGCNARILCICAVPAYSGAFRRKSSTKLRQKKHECNSSPCEGPRINIEKAEEDEDTLNEDGYQSDSESSDDEPMSFNARTQELYVEDVPSDDDITKRPAVSPLTRSTPDPISTTGSWVQDAQKSTMWLGTEDGCIHIFQCTDNIKTTKNKLKIQHGSPVYGIVYLDNKVFVSLANGDLIVYKRDLSNCGLWDTGCPYTRTIGSVMSPITKMLAVAGKLWCGSQNSIHVINPLMLTIEKTFQVGSDANRSVQCMVCSGQGVWVASQQSSKVNLFHATTFEFLMEVSIAQGVSSKLQSADDIIRQHKAACLRITSLLVCKDLLWVGTSAGVILTMPILKITSTTSFGSLPTPTVTGLVYGHTGHVRFLTSVELSMGAANKSNNPCAKDTQEEGITLHDIHRRSSLATTTATMATRMLVISGGDGYEDFRNTVANEAAGRDDSTNHLLLWQV
ncbi:rho guanine nucleotide exchange factor 17-like isoform X2 [Gigantopelta aegis]|uniref:rho guanine nucleotide exchange factor 17-like isoform X2 n=1 Tax=Gigantopelta aegis TaxID=1735272 RepID=UPI001B888BFE|nr:rho guanine nucleotide exchange factor 17-like isoform X2 [Gigantopelta aegis]